MVQDINRSRDFWSTPTSSWLLRVWLLWLYTLISFMGFNRTGGDLILETFTTKTFLNLSPASNFGVVCLTTIPTARSRSRCWTSLGDSHLLSPFILSPSAWSSSWCPWDSNSTRTSYKLRRWYILIISPSSTTRCTTSLCLKSSNLKSGLLHSLSFLKSIFKCINLSCS